MPTETIFGLVAIGKDTSGNFKLSPYGLAVRSSSDGNFVARHNGELVDVTNLTFDVGDNLIYRIPKRTPVPKKDIIVRSDNPFSVLFVDTVDTDGSVTGTDPSGNIQSIRPVTNLLTEILGERTRPKSHVHFFVTVAGPDDLFTKGDSSLLPLLLLSGQNAGTNMADPLTTLLLVRSLGSKTMDDQALSILSILRGGTTAGNNDALALVLALRGSNLFDHEYPAKGMPKPNTGKRTRRRGKK